MTGRIRVNFGLDDSQGDRRWVTTKPIPQSFAPPPFPNLSAIPLIEEGKEALPVFDSLGYRSGFCGRPG